MKLKYAKLWLKKWIKYNYVKYDKKTFNRKLDRKIKDISHRVYKSHGLKGHNTRQMIRKKLWAYCKMELKRYRPSTINRIQNFIKRFISRLKLKKR